LLLLPWFELWRELSLSTEGNQPIPHELADRAISWSRSQESVFFFLLWFFVIGLKLGVDVLKISFQHSQEPTGKVSSQSELFWSSFDLFFLGSCCCFWIAWSLQEKHRTSGTQSLRGKIRNLRESPNRGASGGKRGASAPTTKNLCSGSPSARFDIRLLLCLSSVSRILF
jgi:hypothetical protein